MMTNSKPRWKVKPRELRLLIYLAVVLAVAAWKFIPRSWHPTLTLDTPHHRIYSTATRAQTEATAGALTLLHGAFSNCFGGVVGFEPAHPRLQVKLFKDRTEFRRVNPGLGWAEAFYREPYCRAYFSAGESNPYHWMLHEAVHQLNHEVAHLQLEKWLEEGLAEYFSTSRLRTNELALGRIDPNTYPVWWIDELATSADLAENLRNGSVIPLKSILTGTGGPSMRRHFNLYYLHWWTLTHFVFETPQHRGQALKLAQQGGGLAAFEQCVGPIDLVQPEWHAYVRQLKADLAAPLPILSRRTSTATNNAARN
ncbi:MAG TPA: hypothetical protein VFT34_02600 [Verrucomicrobiae bacterium]|nr:hypothetical protein [Verrucomicrobiae bacterium]